MWFGLVQAKPSLGDTYKDLATCFKATMGGSHTFGHSDGNHGLLQERFKLGYILPETLGQ